MPWMPRALGGAAGKLLCDVQEEEMSSSMEPKIPPPNVKAQIGHASCSHCKGEQFRILLDVRKFNAKVGDVLGPENTFQWFGIECYACGEQVFKPGYSIT